MSPTGAFASSSRTFLTDRLGTFVFAYSRQKRRLSHLDQQLHIIADHHQHCQGSGITEFEGGVRVGRRYDDRLVQVTAVQKYRRLAKNI